MGTRLLLGRVLVLVGALWSTSLVAEDKGSLLPQWQWLEPCSYWQQSYIDGRFIYTCQYLGQRMRVYEAAEIERAFNAVDAKLKDLEARVKALEEAR